MPAAEVAVGPDLVSALLGEQHPDLADRPLEHLANGWDNVMVRVGDDLVARLPRRAAAVDLLRQEQRRLPALAPLLPLPVPVPVRTGRPGAGYPWPWSLVPYLPGDVAARTPPADPVAAARTLGTFLAALHRPAPDDAPRSPVRGVPLRARSDAVAANLRTARTVLPADTLDALDALWQNGSTAAEHAGPALWCHGDLHPANALVHDGRLSAVLDFGDLTAGDPAVDLSVAWSLLPAPARPALWDAYDASGGQPDDALVTRARGWATALGLVLVTHSADVPLLDGIGRTTLAAVLGDR